MEIKCNVKSNSGLSDWNFSGDFYDHGNLTGKYWIYSDNNDSTIPKVFMDNIATRMQKILSKNWVSLSKASSEMIDNQLLDVKSSFEQSGFINIREEATKKPFYALFAKKGIVYRVSINGVENFDKGSIFHPESEVCIYFYEI
ncbi:MULTISPECIES: hypothetical protein [Enterococcus]|uniref:hypothetical protein n=1 Tax=Enterococcus TaxID=1350 RepID=UPI00054EFA23|nr:hypothetical protein [Enterococcus sulfureus]